MSTAYDDHTTMVRSPFSTTAFAQLVRRLRHTNARYDQIAHQFRSRIRPTHHAKRRAYMAGLRIDTTKARACPHKYVSSQPPPVLDRSAGSPNTPVEGHATSPHGPGIADEGEEGLGLDAVGQGDACMRGLPLRNLPEVVIRTKDGQDGRPHVVLRLPPPQLKWNVGFSCDVSVSECQGPVPGAPRLRPTQLPEEEGGMEQVTLGSVSSSSSDESDVLLTPLDVDVRVYSGLRITIPPRSLKRKSQDVDSDDDPTFSQQPKRFMKSRWSKSQRH